MKPKLKTYKIWIHVDSGYHVKVKAESEERALELADDVVLDDKDFTEQVMRNSQIGASNIVE